MSSYRPGEAPTTNEVRAIERDGRRWLQQWRQRPGGQLYEYAWVDVAELGPASTPAPASVTSLRPPRA